MVAASNAVDAAIAIEPSGNPAAAGSAEAWLAAMRRADFAAAFAVSDAVLAMRDPATRDDPRLPYHLRWVWDGRSPRGRDVLVRCYHGIGDTLQFCRFLPRLRAVARSVAVEAPPALLPLLTRVPGVDRWIAFDPASPAPPGACDIEIMELAHALRLTPAAVPPPALDVAPLKLAASPSVGLCWRAGDWDGERSVRMDALYGAAIAPGVRPISLQRGAAAAEADARFANPGDTSLDLVRTAALIASCARVVTVDTAVAHLAGTLGRETWLLLKAEPDWRWHCADWYPSVRQFRQAAPGDWYAPLAAVRSATLRVATAGG